MLVEDFSWKFEPPWEMSASDLTLKGEYLPVADVFSRQVEPCQSTS